MFQDERSSRADFLLTGGEHTPRKLWCAGNVGLAIFVVLKDTGCRSGYLNSFSSFLGDACAAKRDFSISVDFPFAGASETVFFDGLGVLPRFQR